MQLKKVFASKAVRLGLSTSPLTMYSPSHRPKGSLLRQEQGVLREGPSTGWLSHCGEVDFYKCVSANCLHQRFQPLTGGYCFQHIFPMASFSLIIEAKLDSSGFAQKRASSASSFREQEALGASRGPSARPDLFLREARGEGPMGDRGDPAGTGWPQRQGRRGRTQGSTL